MEMGLTLLLHQKTYILLEGELTKRILLEHGVPRGNEVSPNVFILAVELLLIKINNTKLIQGINYAQKESRRETFADDTSNPRKTHDILGDKHCYDPNWWYYDINDKLCPELALSWENKFTLLGFKIYNRLK